MNKKPKTYWAIQHWEGEIVPQTVRRLRRDAIEAFLWHCCADDDTWADLTPTYKAIKVHIVKADNG